MRRGRVESGRVAPQPRATGKSYSQCHCVTGKGRARRRGTLAVVCRFLTPRLGAPARADTRHPLSEGMRSCYVLLLAVEVLRHQLPQHQVVHGMMWWESCPETTCWPSQRQGRKSASGLTREFVSGEFLDCVKILRLSDHNLLSVHRGVVSAGGDSCKVGATVMKHVCGIIRELSTPYRLCEQPHQSSECPHKV